MPKAFNWGKTIDAVELTALKAPMSLPHVWEIRSKSGGGTLGVVRWAGTLREYVFTQERSYTGYLKGQTAVDIGKFCQNQTAIHLEAKVKAAG